MKEKHLKHANNPYETLERALGYSFKDKRLLEQALTHKSCRLALNNERLEFLGDAVLDLIVGELLYHKFYQYNEGKLSKLRASIVSEQGFTKLAKAISLHDYLRVSTSEEVSKGREKPSILSSAFEALMAGVYLEAGLDKTRKITERLLNRAYKRLDLEYLFADYKTALQELTQAKFGVIPKYELLKESGPDHHKEFEIALFINNTIYAKAKGKSKKEAEQQCALQGLNKLKEQE
ncbi:ribonuclease III [Helicobacter cetorum]|uniref:Ribonuclease 3 n=1 Tax=Helicobacter cetorum (strain ATCC BAA-540 / CCUG 52418 / MIT 99-5656) TaxID=1163745 RepID=I0ESY8_HELCM|nr:ribonuclease III [Helicobacter cetorum]AFI06057.1 ribonuclease III [Helicobacter cetorum MIT 99-5656]